MGVPNFLSIASNAEIPKCSLKTTEIIKIAWAGLASGCLHTLAGPDHLAALTPLTIGRTRIHASILGALWGLGHSIGQLILGLAFVLLKDSFESFIPTFNKYGGFLIGIILIIIGIIGIYENMFI